MTTITERFINGLKIYNLTSVEIKEWKYCGGNTGKELNRLKEFFKNKELPYIVISVYADIRIKRIAILQIVI